MAAYFRFCFDNRKWISFGFLLTFFSSFGQTFLLSLYVPRILDEFAISSGFFGGLYALATVASALTLLHVGRIIDRVDLRTYTLWAALVLMVSGLVMAVSVHIAMVFVALFGLRFAGQGLFSHISNTTIARQFDATRGKALSITSLGYSTGEGIFPLAVGMLIAYAGWRNALITTSAAVALVLIPFIWFALNAGHRASAPIGDDAAGPAFSRRALLRDRHFYLLAANVGFLPFLVTGLFFHQFALADFKRWDLDWLSAGFVGFAVGRTVFSLLSGQLIDRFSARKLLPAYLIPVLGGLLLLATMDHPWAGFLYLFLTGISVGMSGPIKSAALVELYGSAHLGGIRSVFTTVMVLSTAASPLLFGLLIDGGWGFPVILPAGMVLTVAVSMAGAPFAASQQITLVSTTR